MDCLRVLFCAIGTGVGFFLFANGGGGDERVTGPEVLPVAGGGSSAGLFSVGPGCWVWVLAAGAGGLWYGFYFGEGAFWFLSFVRKCASCSAYRGRAFVFSESK